MSKTMLDFSEDLFMEILSRLPLKSIIQSKCVCKPWLTIITSDRFVKFHLNRAHQRTPNLILASNFHRNFYSLDCEALEESVDLNIELPPLVGISIVGSCNGLLCLSDYKSFVCLWNPSISAGGRFEVELRKDERSTVAMGFGYDSVADKYKLVRIDYFFETLRSVTSTMTEFDRCEVKVYTLGADSSWTTLGDSPSPPCYIGNLSRAVHLNGVLYWVGLRGVGVELSKSIISFNLRNHKFGQVPWPEFEDRSYRDLGLGVLQGCLSAFSYHLEHVDVWVMTKGSWNRHFSIARSTKYLEPLLFQKNGEILLQMGHRSLLSYHPVHQTSRVPIVRGIPHRFRTCTYVESLTTISSLVTVTLADNSSIH